jgi:1,4-dihydroxy-2-naphthoate octaprenyltransferase
MTIGSFFKLVEMQTKAASVIPFAIGTCYAVYRFDAFDTSNFFLMLISLLAIDMATTAINNYQDYKKAYVRHGFGYESHNAIVRYSLGEGTVKAAIAVLLSIAVLFGFLLFLQTDLTVLAVGGASFLFAVVYSVGPVPISRTPFGELFSGGFMGFVIPFLAVHIHVARDTIAYISIEGWRLAGELDLTEAFLLFLVAMPAMTGIANIMLANNICDMEDDLENRRYTLPIMIGREKALKVYTLLYAAGGAAVIAAVILETLPLITLAVLAAVLPVRANIAVFMKKQTKDETFVTSVKNFVLINSGLAVAIGAGIIFF